MLENIALIASAISALTAVTTSLRAVGKSREYARCETLSKIKTGCRTGSCKTGQPLKKGGGLLLHFIVTVIWFVLSIVFVIPLIIHGLQSNKDTWLFFRILPFLLLVILLCFIWRKILLQKN
ncbi:hypothetical protein BMS3Abin06_00171 [bacterium BMS3Abin06]|nr:hypothetical protein BMS3Abin06_00171 [bacterium BMS3Abin06]HDZ02877.1 hypothetical protein [Nitrospirota bacterium]